MSEAFDFLQAEKDPCLGFLLPTLVVLKGRLTYLVNCDSITVCKSLAGCLLNSLGQRFDGLFKDPHLRLAVIVHPMFKLTWLTHREEHGSAVQLLLDEAAKITTEEQTETTDDGDGGSPIPNDRYFQSIRRSKQASLEVDLKQNPSYNITL